MEKLTFQEEEVMLVIWQLESGVIKEFQRRLSDPETPYTTVASIVKNLEKKGFVTSKKHGNVYEYFPKVAEREYKAKFMSGVVQNYFENSYKELVTFFAKEQKISAEELQEIIKLIEKE